ncbi:permease [Raineyella fluvialis]|uniref:Permease n=2 Tax=Raineyella fluvialis TaxID=2662261 RepID=A0A5Q2FEN9_9ACTN|nr:permease [Raineyella fluvialis]
MLSTHYMGLLATNQPWNLLMFMAVPVILAETLAVTELVILRGGSVGPVVAGLNRWAGLIAGPYMIAVTVHLLRNAVIPLTATGGWRGAADVIAVSFYLLGTVPMVGLTLVELGLVGRTHESARTWHTVFVGAFLVIAHVAMIVGMLDPTVLGWRASTGHTMPDGSVMPGMTHN